MKIHSNHPGGGPPSTPPGKGPEKAHGHHQEEFDAVFEQIQNQQEKERQIQREEQEKHLQERENKERYVKEQDLKSKSETDRYDHEQTRNKAYSFRSQQKNEAEPEAESLEDLNLPGQEETGTQTAENQPEQLSTIENQSEGFSKDGPDKGNANKLEAKGLHLGQQAQKPGQEGPGKRIGQTVEHGPKGEGKEKMKESTVGNAPPKNAGLSGKPAGEGQKTENASKAFGGLVAEQQEENAPPGLDENAGFQRAMSKLQEKLLGADALKEPGQAETLHAEKLIKGLEEEQKGDKSQFALGQTLPLSSYLEAVGKPPDIQPPPVQGGLNIAQIEKLVDQMLVGVNATGDPEIKLSLHLPELGQLEVKITRDDTGLSILFNTQSEKAGVQLGQNMTVLQSTLVQRGLQVNNIEFLIQNQPVPLSELIEAVKPGFDAKTLRKDSTSRGSREGKKDRPETGPPPKGR